MRFTKYTALGNDFLVIPAEDFSPASPSETVKRICDRHYGIGSDGLMIGPLPLMGSNLGLKFYNSDGGEFETSGNGLRIFARYLWDCGIVGEEIFSVATPAGFVQCRVHPGGRRVTVEMGKVSFSSRVIPVTGPDREVLDETLVVEDTQFQICAVTVGNPHCVVLCQDISPSLAYRWGPSIENHPMFPNRTNVQFMKVLDRNNIQIEIWERGAGYTLASGSSSCATAASAHRLGLCDSFVSVHVPGGVLNVSISDEYSVTLEGDVSKICEGVAFNEV